MWKTIENQSKNFKEKKNSKQNLKKKITTHVYSFSNSSNQQNIQPEEI